MPPEDFHIQLTAYEKELIKKWIDQGAKYEAHWAYRPVKILAQQNSKIISKTVDEFIRKELKQQGMQQNALESKEIIHLID